MPTLFESQSIDLLSPLPPSDCVSRIAASINVPRSSLPYAERFNSKQIVGLVTTSSLRLRVRIEYRNSFQSVLVAKLKPVADGTEIVGNIGMHLFVRVFLCVWFAGVFLIGGTIFFATARDMIIGSRAPGSNWIGLIVPLIMLFFGFILVGFGRCIANTESDVLSGFLMKTLSASPRGMSTPPAADATSASHGKLPTVAEILIRGKDR
jgi:hypothetical protein